MNKRQRKKAWKAKSVRKREWMYIQKPYEYEMTCDKCDGSNIEWSEWEHLIWCYDCEIDTKGTPGIFGSPIPVNLCKMLGITFKRIKL